MFSSLNAYLFATEKIEKIRLKHAIVLTQVFFLLRFTFSATGIFDSWIRWQEKEFILPLWSVQWMNYFSIPTAVDIICWATLITGAITLFYPNSRLFRLLSAVAYFQLASLDNSFGKINHHLHAWVIISFLLVLLPTGKWHYDKMTADKRRRFLLTFWAIQFTFMLFYTMSGTWKLFAVYQQTRQGIPVTGLHPSAFAHQIAHRLSQSNSQSVLGNLIIQNPWLGWLPYWTAIYLEFCALVVAFRPRLHKLWAGCLILFHVGTWLTMTISFNSNIFLLGLFFWISPFAPDEMNWKQIVSDLPPIPLIRKMRRFIRRSPT